MLTYPGGFSGRQNSYVRLKIRPHDPYVLPETIISLTAPPAARLGRARSGVPSTPGLVGSPCRDPAALSSRAGGESSRRPGRVSLCSA